MPVSSREQRTALTAVTGRAVGALADWWPHIQGAALAPALEEIAETYGLAAGTLAADWYDELRESADVPGRFITEPARLPSSGLYRSVAETVTEGSPDTALARAQGEVQRVVANAHRDTITQLSGSDPKASGWRRVGVGANCPFCRMLIGRGAVYKQATARFASHQHCNCIAAPAFDGGQAIGVMPYSQAGRSAGRRAKDAKGVRDWIAAHPAASPAPVKASGRLAFDPEPFRRAQTPQEASDLLQRHIGDRGRVSGFDADRLDLDRVRDVTEQVAYLFDKFPEMRADINVMAIRNPNVLASAASRRGHGGKFHGLEMRISLGKMRKGSKVQEEFELSAEHGHFHAPNAADQSGMQYAISHEFGHLVDFATKKGLNPQGMERTAVAKAGMKMKSPEHTAWRKQNISGYGTVNRAEMIAEAFADVTMNGAAAFPFSRTIYDELLRLPMEIQL